MIIGTGLDVVHISKIAHMLERWGERFLYRIYTGGEIAYCTGKSNAAIHFAGTFASKEAAYKSLSSRLAVLHWKEIEVSRGQGGLPEVILHGETGRRAREAGIHKVLLSISHSEDIAIAQCIAVTQEMPVTGESFR
jgi:holo-[acyl-carrier protein] synthase